MFVCLNYLFLLHMLHGREYCGLLRCYYSNLSLLNGHALLWETLNLIRELSDKDGGSSNLCHVEEFGNFTATACLNDMPFTGLKYTWSNQLNEAGSGYQQKGRKPSQNDKTEHGMEITVQNQGQSPKMTKSESILKNQQSNRSRN
ncbi:hypothetical protein Tco_1532926 [Tanacetum coccineum]